MSKVKKLRDDLKRSLADAGLWDEQAVITERQSDVWNDIAMAMQGARNGAVLVIGVAEGISLDDHNLLMDLTLPVTILCEPQLRDGAAPEEELWEGIVRHIHGLNLSRSQHPEFAFRFERFSDDVELADGGTGWLARQTVFKVRLTL